MSAAEAVPSKQRSWKQSRTLVMGERVCSCPSAIFRGGGDKANQGVRARHECQEETRCPHNLRFCNVVWERCRLCRHLLDKILQPPAFFSGSALLGQPKCLDLYLRIALPTSRPQPVSRNFCQEATCRMKRISLRDFLISHSIPCSPVGSSSCSISFPSSVGESRSWPASWSACSIPPRRD